MDNGLSLGFFTLADVKNLKAKIKGKSSQQIMSFELLLLSEN